MFNVFRKDRTRKDHVRLDFTELPMMAQRRNVPSAANYVEYTEARKKYSWKLIRSWLDQCLHHHTLRNACIHPSNSPLPYCPKRLIDVRNSIPRLVLKGTLETIGQIEYATLSYCWGGSMPEFGKTKSGTLALHLESLELELLPRTFRDAIEIAQGLNIPFLWIDALCIVQDSRYDWEEQAALMGAIYSGSMLTIAASVSNHCDGGCLIIQPELQNLGPEDVPESENLEGRTSPAPRLIDSGVNWALAGFGPDSRTTWSKSFEGNPLLSRGWTLQERELSPRIVYFTATQILWECRSSRLSELFPRGEPHVNSRAEKRIRCLDVPESAWRGLDAPTSAERQAAIDGVTYEERMYAWRKTVEDYSGRSFTKTEDRFPALHGLAMELQRFTGDAYIAGLWRRNLSLGLAWFVSQTHKLKDGSLIETTCARGYNFPTWSWMSVIEPAMWARPSRPSPPQPVFASHIRREGLRISIISASVESQGDRYIGRIRLRGRGKHYTQGLAGAGHEDDRSPGTILYDIPSRRIVGEEVLVMSLDVIQRDELQALGIVLVPTGEENEFERIGLLNGICLEWFEDGEDAEISIV